MAFRWLRTAVPVPRLRPRLAIPALRFVTLAVRKRFAPRSTVSSLNCSIRPARATALRLRATALRLRVLRAAPALRLRFALLALLALRLVRLPFATLPLAALPARSRPLRSTVSSVTFSHRKPLAICRAIALRLAVAMPRLRPRLAVAVPRLLPRLAAAANEL